MNRRVSQGFLFFTLMLVLLIGVLLKPAQHIHQQKNRLKEIEALYHSLKSKEKIKSVHTSLHQHLLDLRQKEFMTPFDEKDCLTLLTRIAKQHHVILKQFHFETPFEDKLQSNHQIPLSISYTPVTIELRALSETAIRKMIEALHQSAKGIIFPRHLSITRAKTHEFLATYAFFGIRGL